VAILLFTTVRWLWNKWRITRWYRLYHSILNPQRPPGRPFDFKRSCLRLTGSESIRIMVRPRGRVLLKRFDVRLVTFKRRWFFWRSPVDASENVVQLKNIRLVEPNRVTLGIDIQHKQRNEAGGFSCVLSGEILITKGERLILWYDVKPLQHWVGYISFRAPSLGDSEHPVYIPLELTPRPISDTADSQTEEVE